jgi:hypothetical protein
LKSITEHATLDDFGEIMLMSRNIREWFLNNERKVMTELLYAVYYSDLMRKYQNKRICYSAVRDHPEELAYVKNQTENICSEAVIRDGLTLRFVKQKTKQLCYEAIFNNGLALQFVEDQDEDICLEALHNNIASLRFVKNKTEKIREYVSGVMFKLQIELNL